MSFSTRLKELRLLHGLSQAQLAKKLNVSPKTISNWKNERNLPDIEYLIVTSYYYFCDMVVLRVYFY